MPSGMLPLDENVEAAHCRLRSHGLPCNDPRAMPRHRRSRVNPLPALGARIVGSDGSRVGGWVRTCCRFRPRTLSLTLQPRPCLVRGSCRSGTAHPARGGGANEATPRLSSPQAQPARDLAHRLLGPEAGAAGAPDALAASATRACERVLENLSRWVGIDGADALFARALTRAQTQYPALGVVRFGPRSEICLEGIEESARTHGAAAAAEGVAGILTALIELLGRLIGDDLATQLVQQSLPDRPTHESQPTGGENAQ